MEDEEDAAWGCLLDLYRSADGRAFFVFDVFPPLRVSVHEPLVFVSTRLE